MRVNFKYLLLTLGVCGGLASCSNDDDATPIGTGVIDDGTPTSIQLSITQPRSTYADPKDVNATEREAALEKVNVFIYNEIGSLVNHEELSKKDFSYDEPNSSTAKEVYTGTTKIKTTTGNKRLYVGVNLPDGIRDNILSSGLIAGVSEVNNITVTDLVDNTAQNKGFAMFSTGEIREKFVEDETGEANRVTVEVSRLVAKVTVQEGTDLKLGEDISGGRISDLQFAIANSNKKIYPYQQVRGGNIVDPNFDWSTGAYTRASDFQTFDDYVDVDGAGITDVRDLTPKYAPENTSSLYYQDETTYATVKATFVPNEFYDADGQVLQTNVGNAAVSFWTVRSLDGTIKYFKDKTTADAYALTQNGSKVSEKYEDGVCYYNVFLNPRGKYNVVRNTYYKATISKITGLGKPTPDDIEEGEQVETDTYMQVDIHILRWEVEADDYELKP